MSLLELGGKKFTIPLGDVVLGSDAACTIPLSGADVLPRHALLQGQQDGQVIIRKASPAAEVLINGVRLGAEPTPLLHGDKVEVGGHELTFVDERRSGSTQFMQKVPVPEAMAQAKAAAKPGVTGNTGGRIVSLTDGREYVITGQSLVFGREAGCDVVVAGKDVSRRHAEVVQTPKGYLLVDSSTNGTFVNDVRVQGQRLLQRADVIRMGDESFRFYADVLAAGAGGGEAGKAGGAGGPVGPGGPAGPAVSAQQAAPPPAAAAGSSAPAAVPPPSPPRSPTPPSPVPPLGADQRLQDTMHGLDAVPRAAPASPTGPLANFLVKVGALKGQRVQVRTPVANIGRAEYNDIVLPDPSVSTAHAKLQRREGVWLVVDLDSTNGSFVDGERVHGETPLAPGAIVRFGDVQLVFEPTDDALGVAKGGGTQVIRDFMPSAPRPVPPRPSPKPALPAPPRPPGKAPPATRPGGKRPSPAAQQQPQKKGKGCGASAAVLALAVAGLAALLHRLLA
jgi:pSer/pThr/pTyr-binding forkhead associated (FHA) protein